MVDMRRVPVSWTTGIGGTGLSVFYTLDPVDVTTELGTFFNAIKAVFPTVVTWQIPSSGDMLDAETGILSGGWSGGTAATIAATGGAGVYVAGTGAMVRWNTNSVLAGRRLRGRTFLCPLLSSAFDANGTLNDANVTTMQTAANTLVAAGKIRIWSRPQPPSRPGFTSPVLSGLVQDRVTSLRTRRT